MRTIRYCLALVLVLATLPTLLWAESAASTHLKTKLKISAVDRLRESATTPSSRALQRRVVAIDPITISGHLRTEGPFSVTLSAERIRNVNAVISSTAGVSSDAPSMRFLRGTVTFRKHRSHSALVAAAIMFGKHGAVLTLTLNGPGRKEGRSRLYTIKSPLSYTAAIRAKVSAVPSSALRALGCGMEDLQDQTSSAASSNAAEPIFQASTVYKVLEISTDADPEWYATYGTNSNPEILAVLDAVETIYKRDLGVEIEVKSQNVFTTTSSYTSTDASTLLGQFRTYTQANHHLTTADLYHLFTGKNLDGSTAGIAYVGVVCSAASYSYGLSQAYSRAVLTQIVAHELGHNFGANHDVSSPVPGIMAPAVSGATAFSAFSIGEIGTHVASYNSCFSLHDDGATPTPTPTPTATPTPTPTSTPTPTLTPSPTPSEAPTPTPSSPAPTPSAEPSVAPSTAPSTIPTPVDDEDPDLGGAPYLGIVAEKVSAKLHRVYGELLGSSEDPLIGYRVALLRGTRKVSSAVSDQEGLVGFKVRLPGTYRLRAKVEGEVLLSERIRVRR